MRSNKNRLTENPPTDKERGSKNNENNVKESKSSNSFDCWIGFVQFLLNG